MGKACSGIGMGCVLWLVGEDIGGISRGWVGLKGRACHSHTYTHTHAHMQGERHLRRRSERQEAEAEAEARVQAEQGREQDRNGPWSLLGNGGGLFGCLGLLGLDGDGEEAEGEGN